MNKKVVEAFIVGFCVWLLGVAGILLLSAAKDISQTAVWSALILAGPFTYFLTRFHLRDVSTGQWLPVAMRFGVIITLVQFPLDSLIWLSTFKLGYPKLGLELTQAVIIALPIGYLFLLSVPWWVGSKRFN